jgi:HAD superfamily hydrolase (TIGR01549 family)
MPLDAIRIKAVLFDYGNTIIPFGRPQMDACDNALRAALEKHYGPVDRDRLQEIRDADRLAPFKNGYRENDLTETISRLVRRLFDREPSPVALADLLRARFEAVVAAIEAPAYAADVLAAIGSRYRLALVSNYPDGKAIRTSLQRTALAPYFESVVISGDVGFVKPHARPFEVCLDQLGLKAADAVYVGDNWLADVQGAKRVGLRVVWTRQWEAVDNFAAQAGDHQPDAEIRHLTELPSVLREEQVTGKL